MPQAKPQPQSLRPFLLGVAVGALAMHLQAPATPLAGSPRRTTHGRRLQQSSSSELGRLLGLSPALERRTRQDLQEFSKLRHGDGALRPPPRRGPA